MKNPAIASGVLVRLGELALIFRCRNKARTRLDVDEGEHNRLLPCA